MLEPHRQDIYRSEFLLISLYASLLGPEVVETVIQRQVTLLEQELLQINACEDAEAAETRDYIASNDDLSLIQEAGSWARNYGTYCVSAAIDYLNKHGVELRGNCSQGTIHR